METIIVYADDAEYALPILQSMALRPGAAQIHWIIVACAPRVTHRVSKFVSNRARENWRNKWADKLFQACMPTLAQSGATITPVLARTPLPDLMEQLRDQYGQSLQLIDLRRPKTEAVQPEAAPMGTTFRKLLGTVSGIGALTALLIEESLVI